MNDDIAPRLARAKQAVARSQPMREEFAADLLQMQRTATIDATDDREPSG
jgi:hypothetical protein